VVRVCVQAQHPAGGHSKVHNTAHGTAHPLCPILYSWAGLHVRYRFCFDCVNYTSALATDVCDSVKCIQSRSGCRSE
jgi:hypothetical protein